jgi:hypothetical protein
MIQRVPDPQPKRRLGEKHVLLSERIQLRIPIQHPRRHELVKDPDHERWEDGEDDVVKRDRPGLVGDLPRKVVEKGILVSRQPTPHVHAKRCAYPKLRHVERDVLVKRI